MKKILMFILTFTMMYNFAFGQQKIITLWEGTVPNNRVTDESEIWDTSDLVRVRNVQIPDIAVYLPPKRVSTGQAVVICPGGGYGVLSYQWEGIEVAKWLNSKGIAGIILKYRLPYSSNNIIRYESPLLDAKRAMRLVRYHADKWNIDKNNIGILGFSAGGHLASSLLTQFDEGIADSKDPVDKVSSRPDFGVLLYPVISMYVPDVHMGSRINLLGEEPGEDLLRRFSGHLNIQDNTPQVFLVHSSDDGAVPVSNSIMFYKALQEKGISAELHIYPFGGHGYSLGLEQEYLNSWTDRCIDWLNWITKQNSIEK